MNDVGLKNLNNFPKLPELSIVKNIKLIYNIFLKKNSLNYQIMN